MLESLKLPIEHDFSVFEFLGNTGSVALPTALALGIDRKGIAPGDRTGLLGIGSGINSVMIAKTLRQTYVSGEDLAAS